jgi:hypothetical protein
MKPPARFKATRLAGVVLACAFVNTVLHAVGPSLVYPNPSRILGNKEIFGPLAGALLAVAYLVLAWVFARSQHLLPGTPVRKGLLFGAAFVPVWFMGVVAMHFVAGSPLSQELRTGLVDVTVLTPFCVLIGLVLGSESKPDPQSATRPWLSAVLTLALTWLVFRYGVERPLLGALGREETTRGFFFWELGMGLCVAWLYLLVGCRDRSRGPLAHALWFGGFVFGIFYLASALFVPLLVVVERPLVLGVGTLMEVLFVVVGVYAHDRLFGSNRAPAVDAAGPRAGAP